MHTLILKFHFKNVTKGRNKCGWQNDTDHFAGYIDAGNLKFVKRNNCETQHNVAYMPAYSKY